MLKPYAKNLQTGEVRQIHSIRYDAKGNITRVVVFPEQFNNVTNYFWKDVRYTFAQDIEQAKELLQ